MNLDSDPHRRTVFLVDIPFFLWSDKPLELQMVPSMAGLVDPVFKVIIWPAIFADYTLKIDEMARLFDVFSLEVD